jgi:hypothetical protein
MTSAVKCRGLLRFPSVSPCLRVSVVPISGSGVLRNHPGECAMRSTFHQPPNRPARRNRPDACPAPNTFRRSSVCRTDPCLSGRLRPRTDSGHPASADTRSGPRMPVRLLSMPAPESPQPHTSRRSTLRKFRSRPGNFVQDLPLTDRRTSAKSAAHQLPGLTSPRPAFPTRQFCLQVVT